MALLTFTITIFVSAFLLFLVQPIVGKLILPKLGGTPQVWNTCMVFFQSVLLLGYAYTHTVSTRLKLRQQLMLHGAVLIVPIIMLWQFPIYSTVQGWPSLTEGSPVFNTLVLLGLIIGVPFFVVSTSAPLLQKWFGYSGHEDARDPYFLYAASNLGSMLSLFYYPSVVEPWTELPIQSWIWFGGYIALAGLVLYCAVTLLKTAPTDEQILAAEAAAAEVKAPSPNLEMPLAPPPPVETSTALKAGAPTGAARSIQRKKGIKLPGKADEAKEVAREEVPDIHIGAQAEMTTWRRIRWVLLAAVPSSLMLGVTSYISTDLSPFPLVWIIPLALYLFSFICVYTKMKKIAWRKAAAIFGSLMLGLVSYITATDQPFLSFVPLVFTTVLALLALAAYAWINNFGFDWTGKRLKIFGGPGYTLHQMMLYVGHPMGLLLLCYIVLSQRGFSPVGSTVIVMLGFFATALACHGELALDRPSTRHLTEYFLLMSVGGMVGGVFNGIIAPVVFQTGVLEFYIVIVVACFVRPQYVPSGWFDELIMQAFPSFQTWCRNQGDEFAKSMGRPTPSTTYVFSFVMDIILGGFVLGISYYLATGPIGRWVLTFLKVSEDYQANVRLLVVLGVPMMFCFFFAGRPLRMTLAVLGLMLGNLYFPERNDRDLVEARRTYFGLLKVMKDVDYSRDVRPFTYGPWDPEEKLEFFVKPTNQPIPFEYMYLMHGTTYHGRNYLYTEEDKKRGIIRDVSRLATTYYHRYGPVGIVMERYNWFKGKQNTFDSDARLPAAMFGQVAAAIMSGNPGPCLVECQSGIPFATIGLGTGTMASYSRPFDHMTYYEIDEVMRGFSIPEQEPAPGANYPNLWPRFTYLEKAIKRGVKLEVIMGDARQSLQREEHNDTNSLVYAADFAKKNPPVPEPGHSKLEDRLREKYYKVIVVDAFSSDAIPIHLCTLEALRLYMSKLSDDGVLCMHTSNRHMDLVRPVARIAMELSKESVAKAKKSPEYEAMDEKQREEYEKKAKINCLVGKDGGGSPQNSKLFGSHNRFMGLFGSEYVMIYRGDDFTNWVKYLDTEKKALIEKGAMKELESTYPRLPPVYSDAPSPWQVLNSVVQWSNPYDRSEYSPPITAQDPLWTDNYSNILSVLRLGH